MSNNNAKAILQSNVVDTNATSIPIPSNKIALFSTKYPYSVTYEKTNPAGEVIKREIMSVTGKSGNNLVVSRRSEFCPFTDSASTQTKTAVTLDAGGIIEERLTADFMNKVQDINTLNVEDIRGQNLLPNDAKFYRQKSHWGFVERAVVGLPDNGESWSLVNTINKWDSSNQGHRVTQIAYNGDRQIIRNSTSPTTWWPWQVQLDSVHDQVIGGINNFSQRLEVPAGIQSSGVSSYDKIRVWSSGDYAIGMNSGMWFGFLNDFAMTFTMAGSNNRGWVWRNNSHSGSQGAMSITLDGRMALAQFIEFNAGDSVLAKRLRVWGINRTATDRSCIFGTENLHLDSADAYEMYLNWYSNKDVRIGNGANFRGNRAPSHPEHMANKAYVDSAVAGASGGWSAQPYAVWGRWRYVRDWVNGSNQNGGSHWCEIRVFEKITGDNVALGKPVSSSNGGVYLTKVTDGVGHPNYADGSGLTEVTIDLGSVYDIASIQVQHYTDARIYNDTKTEVSRDGATWFTVFDSANEGLYEEVPGSQGKTHSLGNMNTYQMFGKNFTT